MNIVEQILFPTSSAIQYAVSDLIGSCAQVQSSQFMGGNNVRLKGLTMLDKDNQRPIGVLHVFGAPPTGTFTDNSPLDLLYADLKNEIAVIKFEQADYIQTKNFYIAQKTTDIPIALLSQTGSLWFAFESRSLYTMSSTQSLALNLTFGS